MAKQKSTQQTLIPYNGELFRSPNKMYEETIFFVHFFQASKKALLRHIKWVNAEGFDAFAFDLEKFDLMNPPINSNLDIGLKYRYTDQIEYLLNELPGNKIVYSFSNPSAAAIEALSRRKCADIKGLICDSGPTAKLIHSVYNLCLIEKNYSTPRALAMSGFMSLLWDRKLHGGLRQELEKFPENFPILSIRGWKDPLIPPEHIDAIFEPHDHLDWRKLALPEAGHLNGLRDFPKEYKLGVKNFLDFIATPMTDLKNLHSRQKPISRRNQAALK